MPAFVNIYHGSRIPYSCTSLSRNLIRSIICLMTSRGANSESFTMKAETDLGPRVSLVLNSLLLSSLPESQYTGKSPIGWKNLRISSAS